MRRFALLLLCPVLAIIVGCSSDPGYRAARGHWGDRTSYRDPNAQWVHDFFADSDGHLVGWIEHEESSASVAAHCEVSDNPFVLYGERLGYYDRQVDAQFAVEDHCLMDKPKGDDE